MNLLIGSAISVHFILLISEFTIMIIVLPGGGYFSFLVFQLCFLFPHFLFIVRKIFTRSIEIKKATQKVAFVTPTGFKPVTF